MSVTFTFTKNDRYHFCSLLKILSHTADVFTGEKCFNHNRDASMTLMFLWSSHIIVKTLVYNNRSSPRKHLFFYSAISTKSPGVLLLCFHTYHPFTISLSHKKTCRYITIVRDWVKITETQLFSHVVKC